MAHAGPERGVLDIKPWFAEFGPRGPVRQADWSTTMLSRYFALHAR
jgi:hypothetical protein